MNEYSAQCIVYSLPDTPLRFSPWAPKGGGAEEGRRTRRDGEGRLTTPGTGNKNSATPFYIAKAEAAARNHCLSHSPLSFEKTNSLSLLRVKLLCTLQKLT
jgi:hypothetical protein